MAVPPLPFRPAQIARRAVLAGGLPLALGFGAAGAGAVQLRIGYQKNGSLLVLKQQISLERRFAGAGVAVSWHEFPSGPPMLEAMNADGIDFGATGDTPPLFAQAAGADLVYAACQPVIGRSLAVLVQRDGPVRSLAGLAGKRIGVTKGSSAHAMLVRVLETAGIAYGSITPVYLQPPDAMAAFQQGDLDAWCIWDPFFAAAEQDPAFRVLTTAEGIAPSNSFFLARRAFAVQNPALMAAVLDETTRVTGWIGAHRDELAQLLSAATGVPYAVERVAALRGNYETGPVTEAVIADQQAIADRFYRLGLLPRAIRVAAAVWRPPG